MFMSVLNLKYLGMVRRCVIDVGVSSKADGAKQGVSSKTDGANQNVVDISFQLSVLRAY